MRNFREEFKELDVEFMQLKREIRALDECINAIDGKIDSGIIVDKKISIEMEKIRDDMEDRMELMEIELLRISDIEVM